MAHITRARENDICVFVGRFQPLHTGHMGVILQALEHAEFLFIIIGSANIPRRPDANPFFADERIAMLKAAIPSDLHNRIVFIPMEDSDYDTIDWVNAVTGAVVGEGIKITGKADPKISLIGHSKDQSSFYLKLFPQWGAIEVASNRNIHATDLRNLYFSHKEEDVEAMFKGAIDFQSIPLGVINWLRDFQKQDIYRELVAEKAFYDASHARWARESWPGSRNTVTGDALILQSNHVLLIQRGEFPQKGTWGTPGGHTNTDETIFEGALREGYEETGIKVPRTVFEKSFVGEKYFDKPRRDPRGRYVSHVFMFHLQPVAPAYDPSKSPVENRKRVRDALALPKVKGMDDAQAAKWWHLDDLDRSKMFLDHYSIIRKMVAQFGKGN